MSWLSDIGGFVSDSVGDIFDSDIFSTQNILSGIGQFASVYSQGEKQKQAEELARSAFDNDIFKLNLQHQNAIEMAKLQAALRGGGGGGGGGGPNYEAIERLRAMMQAKELQTQQANQGANLTVQAYNNLMQGAQAPLMR